MLEKEGHRKKIILASTSPRRKEILELLKFDFEVLKPSSFHEKKSGDLLEAVTYNSERKARSVYESIKSIASEKVARTDYSDGYLIAGFDTVVFINNRFYGKPASQEEAFRFIKLFSGKVHNVVSGICIFDSKSGRYKIGSETTKVRFRDLKESEIKDYISREYTLDKAGGYNINGFGAILIEKINGCFYNVAGLPISKFIGLLEKFNYKVLNKAKE